MVLWTEEKEPFVFFGHCLAGLGDGRGTDWLSGNICPRLAAPVEQQDWRTDLPACCWSGAPAPADVSISSEPGTSLKLPWTRFLHLGNRATS